MRVLIGCEESQIVCKAFRERGNEAYSCDLEPTRGNPNWHLQCDVKLAIRSFGPWDLIILHPPCDYLAVCGNRWYGRGTDKYHLREQAIEWTVDLWELAIKHSNRVVLENPVSVIFKWLRKYGANVQYVQPWQFGHGETKKTGLALHGVPELIPTQIVGGREQRIWKMAPGPTRKRDRSETYKGIANAMADQCGAING